ncbi:MULTISPECIES: DUF4345 domain-containing protein [unclassified Ruegeria]|uniref:DUF4345 domain-containing protein n=1 Tax=unclassified Ruegeria TaxID=2625375 RepID=UPI00135C3361|nr:MULTISPECIES: DUF4345 domain-containing protein [unclassified Ruegeria]
MSLAQLLLLISSVGLVPIALSYGAKPKLTMKLLYGADINDNIAHILRAVMGLYFAVIASWIIGIANPAFTDTSLIILVVFMFGLAGGRVLSLFAEGRVHFLLHVYMALEILIGTAGYYLLSK